MFIIPILHFLQFFEIFRRNLPIFSLETPTEISHAIHTYHKGDLTDAILTLQKQMLGILHLILADIFVGRYTRERLHLAIERTGTYRQVTGNQVNIHITTDILFYQLIQLVKEFLIYLIERFLNCSFFRAKLVSFDSCISILSRRRCCKRLRIRLRKSKCVKGLVIYESAPES